MAIELSQAQCVLLAVHYASESNIKALHSFVPLRHDAFEPELVLRILLTYLPESVQPSTYTTFVQEVASRIWIEQQDSIQLDLSPVQDISDATAQKRVKKLHLLPLQAPAFPPDAPDDALTNFICHRAHKIDAETGILTLIPELVTPFLDKSDYVRTWYISIVLPLLRLHYEYYPDGGPSMSLDNFERMDADSGVNMLLSKANDTTHEITSPTDSEGMIGRDLRGLVGPWMYGHTERKRRKLNGNRSGSSRMRSSVRRVSLNGVAEEDKTGHDWEYVNKWLVQKAVEDFPMVTNAVEEWDGPGDVDLGGYEVAHAYLDQDTQSKLEKQYAQAAFASCYAVETDSPEAIDGAHGILVRLAALLDFEPPPDLAASIEQLPKIDDHASLLHGSSSPMLLEPDVLLKAEHPLTSPTLEAFMLLQMLVYSAYQLAGLGHSISIVNVAKLRFYSDEDEQLALLSRILSRLVEKGKRDEQQWVGDRSKLLWLWNWAIDPEDGALRGAGVFGSISRDVFENEIVKALLQTANYSMVEKVYVDSLPDRTRLSSEELEAVIIEQAMQSYDNASNGNRTRGSMKKASDIINTFGPRFPGSIAFKRASALLAATHALSFYSLTLQHGVPFQPVNIRVSQDPLSLIPKVLEQNPRSYAKLDDLIGIGRNLVSAGLKQLYAEGEPAVDDLESETDLALKVKTAERRVVSMCIEAALTEDDFDTAYSYLVSRLAPEAPTINAAGQNASSVSEDDISWRAAFLAGRYRPRDMNKPSIRRLEQRTELLSLALLLAPASALSEILTVWRRCEEEMSVLIGQQASDEQSFDDHADKRHQGPIPGTFSDSRTEGMVFGQKTRDMGRVGADEGEAPMGLFDVARGAAKAFSRNAFPLRGAAAAAGSAASGPPGDQSPKSDAGSFGHERGGSLTGEGSDGRVRRRDMVASAVTGGLASGIGWMLGATPVERQQQQS